MCNLSKTQMGVYLSLCGLKTSVSRWCLSYWQEETRLFTSWPHPALPGWYLFISSCEPHVLTILLCDQNRQGFYLPLAFAYAVPLAWNALPPLRLANSCPSSRPNSRRHFLCHILLGPCKQHWEHFHLCSRSTLFRHLPEFYHKHIGLYVCLSSRL